MKKQSKFGKWMSLKEKVNAKSTNPPFVKEGDIWWINIGQNIGFEICGKGSAFLRPVIILKKLSKKIFLCDSRNYKE